MNIHFNILLLTSGTYETELDDYYFSSSLSFVATVWSDIVDVRVVSAHVLHRLWRQVRTLASVFIIFIFFIGKCGTGN